MDKMDFDEDSVKSAKEFSDFYFDLLQHHLQSLETHLTDNTILDWFGQTVKGPKKISAFLKEHAHNAKHLFHNIEPCHSVGYRDIHVMNSKYTSTTSKLNETFDLEINITTPEYQEKTPPGIDNKPPAVPARRKRERGQGDGHHNCNPESPMKRTCLGDALITTDSKSSPLKIRYATSDGHVEFRRKSPKKYQKEVMWSRPCKFQAAYSEAPSGYVIYRLIYQSNMRCRRNLLKEFEALSNEK